VARPQRGAVSLAAWLDREAVFSWLMMALPLLFLAVLVGYPLVYGVLLSLEDRVVTKPDHFVGLKNFITDFHDPIFWRVAINTFVYTIAATLLKMAGGLGLAHDDRKHRQSGVAKLGRPRRPRASPIMIRLTLFPFYRMAITSIQPDSELYNRHLILLLVHNPTGPADGGGTIGVDPRRADLLVFCRALCCPADLGLGERLTVGPGLCQVKLRDRTWHPLA
jgi:ABC-type glycerol-3-phosphate transport system permease component